MDKKVKRIINKHTQQYVSFGKEKNVRDGHMAGLSKH